MDEVIGSRVHQRSESWCREHIICVLYRSYTTLLLLLFLLLSFGLSDFFSRSYINICRASLQARGDSLYLVQKLLITKRERERERETERISKLGRNWEWIFPSLQRWVVTMMLAFQNFSSPRSLTVYMSHTNTVFFFLWYLIEIP